MIKHTGTDFEDFLVAQDMAEEVSAAALQRVIAWQLTESDAGMTSANQACSTLALGQRVEVRLVPTFTADSK